MGHFNNHRDRNGDGSAKKRPNAWNKWDRNGWNHWVRNPGWFNRIFNTPKRRTDDRRNANHVLRGIDPDALQWHGDKKPKALYF